jgi:hypothetical protein
LSSATRLTVVDANGMTRQVRFPLVRVGFDAGAPQRRSQPGMPLTRIADNCARLCRASTLVALRRGRETYETAALPLSYAGPDREYGDGPEAAKRAAQLVPTKRRTTGAGSTIVPRLDRPTRAPAHTTRPRPTSGLPGTCMTASVAAQ